MTRTEGGCGLMEDGEPRDEWLSDDEFEAVMADAQEAELLERMERRTRERKEAKRCRGAARDLLDVTRSSELRAALRTVEQAAGRVLGAH